MSGYDLKEGYYDPREVSDDELWSAFSCVFSSRSRNDSSYKFGFLKSIIDNLYNVDADLKLSFDQLFAKFAEIYWNLILKYDLRQKARTSDNKKSRIEQILLNAKEKYQIIEIIPFESLSHQMMIEISYQVKIKCKTYVIGALFEDTKRLFYSFSKKKNGFRLTDKCMNFYASIRLLLKN